MSRADLTTAIEAPVITSIELKTGVTLPYVEQGRRAATPVVLLHGYGDSWRSYERVLPHLPASLRVFAITQRGHGDASRPQAGYHPQDFVADVAAFLDAMEIEDAVIVGHSMGSHVARRFAIAHPKRTRALVLVGAFHSFQDKPDVDGLAAAVAQLREPLDPEFVEEFQRSTLAQTVPDAFFRTIVRESLKMPARVWQSVLPPLLADDVTEAQRDIKAPTLIVWGDKDTFALESDQQGLLAGIHGSQLVVYQGAGHCPQWEEPQRFADDLLNFIESRVAVEVSV